ncbi:MAG: dihydrofolate reductase [Minisyncoccia bacterium]
MTIVVGYGENFVIGNKGTLPNWKLPGDMAHFKELTMDDGNGSIVVMGRKTYESFPIKYRPLPGRHNWIFSRQVPRYEPVPDHFFTNICTSFDEVYWLHDFDGVTSNKKIFIIGGAELYAQALTLPRNGLLFVDKIIATEIEGIFEGDTFFPAPDYSQWERKVLKEVPKDERNSHNFNIVQYIR